MTIGAMWVRHYGGGASSELVVVSDSRLSGGKRWDQCPKIIPMARGDCIMSFSGETDYAYPLLFHVIATIDSWEESRNRRFNLESLRGHLTRVLNSVLSDVDFSGLSSRPAGDPTFLLLGGYSWSTQRWIMWEMKWDVARAKFTCSTRRMREEGQRGAILWIGDKDAVHEAKRRLNLTMRDRNKIASRDGLNMEPLEVTRDIIRGRLFPSVGGPLQIGKVYRHLDSRLFLVPWMSNEGADPRLTLGGRYLLANEINTRLAAIDPNNPDVFVLTSGTVDTPELSSPR